MHEESCERNFIGAGVDVTVVGFLKDDGFGGPPRQIKELWYLFVKSFLS